MTAANYWKSDTSGKIDAREVLLLVGKHLPSSLRSDEANATGWYVHGPTEVTGAPDTGRRVFFESVGLQVSQGGQE